MATVEKVAGNHVYIRGLGRFERGDRAEVDDEDLFEHLLEVRDDFERVDEATAAVCGTEMSDGSTCERPADECPYHGAD